VKVLISNEFARVEVEQQDSANGQRLLIRDPSTGASIYLDALELEAITRLRHQDFGRFIAALSEDEDLDEWDAEE
jgi:hypothetical protein